MQTAALLGQYQQTMQRVRNRHSQCVLAAYVSLLGVVFALVVWWFDSPRWALSGNVLCVTFSVGLAQWARWQQVREIRKVHAITDELRDRVPAGGLAVMMSAVPLPAPPARWWHW